MKIESPTSKSNSLWEFVPKAINIIVSLSALGYFSGWRESQAYYASIGASWAASSVPPLTLLQLSANTIAAVFFGGFFSLTLLIDNKIEIRKLSWACAFLLFVASSCLVTSQGFFGQLSSTAAYLFAYVGSLLCAVTAGVTLTELYGHSRASQNRISVDHLWLIYWVVLPGLFWAPDRLGQAQSLRDMDATHSPLPIVSFESTLNSENWRLVQLLQDKAILVQLDTVSSNRKFKVIEIKDIKSISFSSGKI
jgi:hypothetical protein